MTMPAENHPNDHIITASCISAPDWPVMHLTLQNKESSQRRWILLMRVPPRMGSPHSGTNSQTARSFRYPSGARFGVNLIEFHKQTRHASSSYPRTGKSSVWQINVEKGQAYSCACRTGSCRARDALETETISRDTPLAMISDPVPVITQEDVDYAEQYVRSSHLPQAAATDTRNA
jgi:hypothetical protein